MIYIEQLKRVAARVTHSDNNIHRREINRKTDPVGTKDRMRLNRFVSPHRFGYHKYFCQSLCVRNTALVPSKSLSLRFCDLHQGVKTMHNIIRLVKTIGHKFEWSHKLPASRLVRNFMTIYEALSCWFL